MKNIVNYGLLAVVLSPFLFGIYSVWWIECTYEIFHQVREYSIYFAVVSRDIFLHCNPDASYSFLDCLRQYGEDYFEGQGPYDLDEIREFFIPPEDIKHLGYLVANDLKLYDNRTSPIFVCKTPIADVRPRPGEPSGKNHLAVFGGSVRKMTPEEFMSLDKSLYIDVESVIRELPNKSIDSQKQ